MKKFLSSNWKKIIYFISGFAILINLILVIFTPKTIIDDYIKYGPNYSVDLIDKAQNLEAKTEIIDETAEKMSNDTGISDTVSKSVIIFAILICAMLVLQNVIEGNQASAKKK